MKRSDIEQLVSQEVETIIAGTDLELVDVEYVRERDWYLRVFIDKEGGVGLEDCQAVSENSPNFSMSKIPLRINTCWKSLHPGWTVF